MNEARLLVLYTTAGCHLCEQAAAMLAELEAQGQVRIEAVDIANDEQLVERYGIRIPVVKDVERDQEIGWPFAMGDLLRLIA